MSGQNAATPQSCYDIPRLLQLCEGLGDNCDFGVLQRAVGIEPFGLFRFATCKAADVGALLRTRFQLLGEPEDLWLDEVGPRREYWVKSRRSSFEAHTQRYADGNDLEAVRSALIERTRFLKTRLVRDLSRGRRLCVWKGPAEMAAVADIAAQLRTYSPPNCLLWVQVADAARVPGSVERASEGVLLGFLSRYGDYNGGARLPVEEWIQVCANAYRLWRDEEPPRAPLGNLIAQAMDAHTCRWFAHSSSTTRPLEEPAPTGGAMFEHRLGAAEETSVYIAQLPIASGGSFAFSAWIRVPEEFRGRRISAVLNGYPSIAMWTADPKSYARWQRVWVTANLPLNARSISCEITAEGAVGEVFHSASWCLERGSRPLGNGFVL